MPTLELATERAATRSLTLSLLRFGFVNGEREREGGGAEKERERSAVKSGLMGGGRTEESGFRKILKVRFLPPPRRMPRDG